MSEYKRILTVQDISCVGQCSLTVALPILSACGVETAVLPSAVKLMRMAFAMSDTSSEKIRVPSSPAVVRCTTMSSVDMKCRTNSM